MCDPTGGVLTAVAIGAVVGGGALSAKGAYDEGVANKNMYDYQANATGVQQDLATRAAEQNTTSIQTQASQDSKVLARRAAQVAGAQKSAMAANGVAGSVTANDIALDAFDTAKLDQMAVKYNADLKTWAINEDLKGELWNLEATKNQYKQAGKNAKRAANYKMATSIIGTAGQLATLGMMAPSGGAGGADKAIANTGYKPGRM